MNRRRGFDGLAEGPAAGAGVRRWADVHTIGHGGTGGG